jgi:hypothetical protein
MWKSRFTDEQIVAIVREAASGARADEAPARRRLHGAASVRALASCRSGRPATAELGLGRRHQATPAGDWGVQAGRLVRRW